MIVDKPITRKYYSIAEAAKHFGVTTDTLTKWANNRKLLCNNRKLKESAFKVLAICYLNSKASAFRKNKLKKLPG